ncbi:MAG TPA: tRNA (N6-isopentenyl adenosine(37)-C2)-methylthiotransferase MiaB [Deltaproteobacteria bacterium]|nr:tRNA (N6-isopentenyl adenosine(37)-C2)-methylthiotransferase MiaB [Deltaproteobacteria bacterium]
MKGFVKIFTYGCQMNDLDSIKMYSMLAREGWVAARSLKEADIIILNTCSVRQKAYEKVLSNLGRLKPYKRIKPHLIIAVTGCVAQQEGAGLIERMPHVDIVLGTHELHRLTAMIQDVPVRKEPAIETSFSDKIPSLDLVPDREFISPSHRAYMNIMQGCNNYCSYCIVPYVRGREISRDYPGIIEEVKGYASSGVKEIFLLGQNVNSYSGGKTFPDLLRMIHDIDGIERIRFTTSHPKDMSDDLISCFGSLDKLCNHIHLPFQSGSNSILKDMNRDYTRETYLSLIDRLRSTRPDLAFSADVMVGFPGETDKDYHETLDLIERVRFDLLFSFRYSRRPGTESATFRDDISEEDKLARLRKLQDIQKKITIDISQARIGCIFDVLVDAKSTRHEDQVFGRTTQNAIVNFAGDPSLIGTTVKVKISRANPNSLTGEMV